MLLKTNSYFCWLSLLHSVWVRKPKKWQEPVPDHFDGSDNFFSELFFCITVWRASKEHSNSFETKSNLKCSPLTSKATSGYFGQCVWNWIKGNVPFPFPFKKADLTGTIKALPNLPVGAGKFPPVTCGNRRQSLPAETAGNRYLRRFLPASAGIFTCGSVYLRPSQVVLHAPVLQWVPIETAHQLRTSLLPRIRRENCFSWCSLK